MTDPIERDKYGGLLEHEYDGIREYDNPTPGWWHTLFLASVLFAVVYYFFFTFSPLAWTPQSQLAAARTREFQIMFAEVGELEPDQPTILKMMVDPKWLAVANGIFATNCTSCHGANGEGLVGPNMTDDSYKNLKVLTDIPNVIRDGAANGAMPAWGNRLNPNEIVLLAGYVASLRGQNLPGRAPEGQVIAPWPTPPPPPAVDETDSD
jgi:cytochrome c oxidase cbb3-type subunit III